MPNKSYAQTLRESLLELPVKKKCCAHAIKDANALYEGQFSPVERAEQIARYEKRVKCPGCMSHFIRALFISCGSVTDPAKRNHMEFAVDTAEEADAIETLLASVGFPPARTVRKNKQVVYFKDGEVISDFFGYIGANTAVFDYMNTRLAREFSNNINRQVNCDTANIRKALQASDKQIRIIRRMVETGVIQTLPESLKMTAELRIKHDQMSMTELGNAHEPPITKSGVSHRLAKIIDFARTAGIDE